MAPVKGLLRQLSLGPVIASFPGPSGLGVTVAPPLLQTWGFAPSLVDFPKAHLHLCYESLYYTPQLPSLTVPCLSFWNPSVLGGLD